MDIRDKQISELQKQVKELRHALLMVEQYIKRADKKSTQLRVESRRHKQDIQHLANMLKG